MTGRIYRSILITGASSGLGKALALHYAADGVQLHLSGLNKDRLDGVAEKCRSIGASVEAKIIDVRNAAEMADWIEKADEALPLDLVIANAGVSSDTSGAKETGDIRNLIREINIGGIANTVAPILPRMTRRKSGQIALMSSMAAFRGLPSSPAYSASKAWVKAWGEALRGRMWRDGIGISVICPGFVRSRITDGNQFIMPMFMEASDAARIIAKGLARNKSLIAFPFRMYLLMWLISALPSWLVDRLSRNLPDKE